MQVDADAILEQLGPARRFADPSGPKKGRLMAARGTLPLPPAQLATVVFALTLDPDPEVQATANATLGDLPDPVLHAVLDSEVPPPLLHALAERFRDDEGYLIKIALNNATSDETACFLATLSHSKLVDVLSQNQIRLLRCSELVEALGENSLTGPATIDRILEFLALERGEELKVTGRAQTEDDAGALEEVPEDVRAELPTEGLAERPAAENPEEAEDRSRSLLSVIQGLSVVQKIRLARFGNGEARSLLVRDRNKIVATAAIRSPKMRENEILAVAKSRNVSDDVIRIIANNREWTRAYRLQLALATNPKTPIPMALKFLNYLSDRDLKAAMRSREVPPPISQQARRILSRKGKV